MQSAANKMSSEGETKIKVWTKVNWVEHSEKFFNNKWNEA